MLMKYKNYLNNSIKINKLSVFISKNGIIMVIYTCFKEKYNKLIIKIMIILKE